MIQKFWTGTSEIGAWRATATKRKSPALWGTGVLEDPHPRPLPHAGAVIAKGACVGVRDGDQVAEDDVFLEADQGIDRAREGGFGEDLGGLLEAGGADEGFGLQARLGDAEEEGLGAGGLGAFALGGVLTGGLGGFVGFAE